MLRIMSLASLSTILQSLIDEVDEDEIGGSKNGGNKTNLSNPSILKKFIRAGYLTSKSAKKGGDHLKRGGGNTKKGVKVARNFNYLTPDNKKAFHHL